MKVRVRGAIVLCLAVLAGCGDDGDQGDAAKASTEFVGKANAEDAYVALALGKPDGDGRFDVVSYVCNRQVPLTGSVELAEWFTGTGQSNAVDLRSQPDTSRLKATRNGDVVTGSVELPGGKLVTFEAQSNPSGTAGLFEVGLDSKGNLTGTSRGGKKMKLSPFEQDGDPGYRGTITAPDGSTATYELFVPWWAPHQRVPRRHEVPADDHPARRHEPRHLDPIARKASNRSTLSGT